MNLKACVLSFSSISSWSRLRLILFWGCGSVSYPNPRFCMFYHLPVIEYSLCCCQFTLVIGLTLVLLALAIFYLSRDFYLTIFGTRLLEVLWALGLLNLRGPQFSLFSLRKYLASISLISCFFLAKTSSLLSRTRLLAARGLRCWDFYLSCFLEGWRDLVLWLSLVGPGVKFDALEKGWPGLVDRSDLPSIDRLV